MTPDTAPLFDRVADCKARLRDHVRVHRHRYRGNWWYVLQDRACIQYYRFDASAYRVIRLMNGERTLRNIRDRLVEQEGEAAPDESKLVRLMASLHANELLHGSTPTDIGELFARQSRGRRGILRLLSRSPFMVRVPLLDPDPFLNRHAASARAAFGWPSIALALLTLVAAVTLASLYWPELQHYWRSRALAPYNLAILCLVYPLVKGVHELAHALAVKRWGGEVHEIGLMFLLLVPLPYVDASAAAAFVDKHKRMMVGAAGIIAELSLAAVATVVWFNIETGVLRDIAFDIMLIGGISTLLFNGNPLLRFDGYYVLADAIEIPNLATRSNQYYGYLVQRYLFGLRHADSPVSAAGERPWFVVYAVAAFVYRVFILCTIVLLVVEKLLVVGVVLGALAFSAQLVLPGLRQLDFVMRNPVLSGHRARALTLVVAISGALLTAVLLVPVSTSTYAQGVVWLPDDAEVRAGADGFVRAVNVNNASEVDKGTLLIESDDLVLRANVRTLTWELAELEARYDATFFSERAEAAAIAEQIQRKQADLQRSRERVGALNIHSPVAGTFLAPGARDMNGRFVRKGDVLGYVTDLSSPTIRAVVKQADADRVRSATSTVAVRLADQPLRTVTAKILREVPSATSQLPSAALGTRGGGIIATEPTDPGGLEALEQFFVFEIALPAQSAAVRVGIRAHLRFEHDAEPLASQWYRSMRQLFLRRLTV